MRLRAHNEIQQKDATPSLSTHILGDGFRYEYGLCLYNCPLVIPKGLD